MSLSVFTGSVHKSGALILLLHTVFLEQSFDLCVGIKDLADGYIVVDSFNEVGNILGNINLVEPLSAEELRCPVGEVSTENAVDDAVLVGLVELVQTVCKDSVGSVCEDTACILLLE